MKTLVDYKMETGFYNEGAIMIDAGESERAARFADIFGDTQGTPDLGVAYNALLTEARRLNAEMHAAIRAANESEGRTIATKPELSRDDWKRLVELQYATRFIDDNDGDMSVSFSLTSDGERLINPDYQERDTYADQVGIDGE